ncbi:MAG: hypothetical protein ACO3C1_10050 [Ilumatobacteraceae bacterium]
MRHAPAPRRALITAGLVVTSLGAVSSCGGGSSNLSSADKPYADAMVASMQLDPENPFTEAESRCIADGTVGVIGADTLEEWGMSPESIAKDASIEFPDMSEDMAKKISVLYFDGGCFDFGALLGRAMAATTGSTIEAEKTACLADTLSGSQAFRDAFVASMMGDDSADPFAEVGDIYAVLSDCGIDMGDLGN